jgi:uncharacterized protein (TIGR02145 family)
MIKLKNKTMISLATTVALGISAYGACSANLDMGGNQIKNLAAPTDDSDSVTLEYMKDYIDSAVIDSMGPGYVEDADGNIYRTMVFGSKEWMIDNLRATTSPTGVATNVRKCNTAEWLDGNNTCYAPVSTDGDAADEGDLDVSKGYLYQWNAAMDGSTTAGARGLCPAGWHIPTDQDFQDLEKFFSTGTNVPDEPTNTGWRFGTDLDNSANGSAVVTEQVGTMMQKSTKLNLSMVGRRTNTSGVQDAIGDNVSFWGSAESGNNGLRRFISPTKAGVSRTYINKANGFSVRCVKDY